MAHDIELNAEQRRAVEHSPGPILVVAGAGSGKTRVLTARVAWLLANGAPPESILAFTFTNRAAREMRERIEQVVGERARALWIGTFHATAVRILRREGAALGIPSGFAIYDREDSDDLLREVIRRLELPDAAYRPSVVLAKISDAKNALVTPAEMARVAISPFAKGVAHCYEHYQDGLRHARALDFDDLIAESVRLFALHPEIGGRYSERFRHVLVDEYQDTNHAQFRLVHALAATHGHVFAVGDDDQSIYGWRGASLANVLEFESAFPGATVLRLEQNYRSTGRILKAANAVIANNRARKGKHLWCEREEGVSLRFFLAGDETEEALRIKSFLLERVRRGGTLHDCAVLYRTHAQSRALETELRKSLIPYEIVGGISFYQRREVKDLLAYLRLALNPSDGVSFWRVWNSPRRGLGPAVRAQVEERMSREGIPPLEALRACSASLTRAARAGAETFLSLVDEIGRRREEPVDRILRLLLERTGYLEFLGDGEDATERRANVEELAGAAAGFVVNGSGSLADFLAEAALVSDIDRMSEEADRVLLLTAHNAKGLEFPIVIVAGLEEGLFPHASSLDETAEMEEERRLFYVAITRARDQVLLTAAAYRRRFDGPRGEAVSRFVGEIPAHLLEREGAPRPRLPHGGRFHGLGAGRRVRSGFGDEATISADVPLRSSALPRHRAVGREVYHESFGRGVVMAAEEEGGEVKLTVRFGSRIKKVMGRFVTGGADGD